ncbi:MAG: peptidase M13 [Xanthomonadales bacterium]|nr:peptidase M13 [Xanthomonadales bacterium]
MKQTTLYLATALALALSSAQAAPTTDGLPTAAASALSNADANDAATAVAQSTIAAPRYGTWGIDTAGMDTSVRPGEDFFAYVSGTWAANTEIPADKSSWGSFMMLRDLSQARVRALVESYAPGDPASGDDATKVAALYRAFMDADAVEALGAEPLQPLLAQIRAADDHQAQAALMGQRERMDGTLFALMVGDDQRDPDHYVLMMRQSGLGLGDRDLYVEERFAPQRERYQAYVAQMLTLAGWNDPEAAAEAVMALETRIANAHWTRAQSRDRDRTYNPTTPAELAESAPGFPWATFFKAAGVDHAERLIVAQDSAIPELAKTFAEADITALQAWQAFRSTDGWAPLLASAFADAHYEFRDRFMSGQPEQTERWKRAVDFVERGMGEAIGRDYVQLYFPPDAKAKMDELVANVRAAMGARLDALDWMSDETKAEAHAKLANFGLKIGYPETWRDYSALKVVNGDLFGNAVNIRSFYWDDRRQRIGKKVDKGEWGMTPQTVNAYYNSVKNEIVFPAGILQPPFFDPDADPAVNYGAIGGVIGHEIIHGFDDQGRKSDGAGVLRDWWSAEDAAKFEVQATRLGGQYESYEFPQLPGMRINGRVAMGENIADLGGLTIALEAFRRSLDGEPAPVLDGFTGEQRVFLGWSQLWRILWRDDALRQQLVTRPHSPGQIRAFAPMRNIDAWYEAFEITEDDALWIAPDERVRIW